MNSPIDRASNTTDDTPPAKATAVRRGRPEHTVATILLMGLVSAAVFYGVAWSVHVKENPTHTWDFRKLTAEESPWKFPLIMREQDGHGVTFVALKTDPGPELIMELDTDTVQQIRATVEVTLLDDGRSVPFSLEWYWASTEQIVAAEGAWPYSTEQGAAFHILDRHRPNVHTVNVSQHERWTGKIAQGFIAVKISPNEGGPFQVRVLHIEFLE